MKEIDVTPDFVRPYFEGKKKYRNYFAAVDSYFHMSFHFDGYYLNLDPRLDGIGQDAVNWFSDGQNVSRWNPYFTRLIDLRRPSESAAIKLYRRNIYLPFTKMQCFKVYNSLRKIIKSPDWKIDYSKSEKPKNIADGQYLEDYCEKNFPGFGSVENWVYSFAFRHMLVDANGLVCVIPETEDEKGERDEKEFPEPVAYVVPSYNVLDYKAGELAVFMVDDHYVNANGLKQMRKKVCVITEKGVWVAKQNDNSNDFSFEQTHIFPIDIFPVVQLGGIIKNYQHECKLYESFLAPMLPGLDAATREVSDADAEVVQHVYSTMWYYSLQNCNNCQGTGKVLKAGKQIVCVSCEGNGTMAKSPYKDMVLKQSSFDADKMPTPPAGYIVKPTDMVKLMAERIEKHVYYGLSAVNMEFLANTPLSQSGAAKEVDRDELNNYVYSIAYHLVEGVVKPVYNFINELRYSGLVKNEEVRKKMLPFIPVPEKYDLLTESVLQAQLKSARESNADPLIIAQLEIELINKTTTDPIVRDMVLLKKKLDPFPGLTPTERADLSFGKTAAQVDVTISTYIVPFLERAMQEFPDGEDKDGFVSMPYDEQMKVMSKYAEEKIKLNSAAQKVMAADPTKIVEKVNV